MMDDPILQAATALALVLIPVLSLALSKIKLKLIFFLPILSLLVSFPMFLFVVIVPDLPISKYLFYISMSLWTGGLFGVFISWVMYRKKRKHFN